MFLRIAGEVAAPALLKLPAARNRSPKLRERLFRNVERGLDRPTIELLGELDLLDAERLAMGLRSILAIRAAVTDMAVHPDERRPILLGDRIGEGARKRVEIVGVLDRLRMPAVGVEAPDDVLGKSHVGVTVDRDVVIVVEVDEVAETEMSGERARLARDAFHHVAVAADAEDAMVEQARAAALEAGFEVFGRDRHPDPVGKALAE